MKAQQKYESGLKHLAAGHWMSAETCFRAAIAAEPGFAMAHFKLGQALRKRNKWRPAAQSFQAAARLDPRMELAHLAVATVARRLGNSDQAETSTRQALQINPRSRDALLLLGSVLLDQGRLDEARAVYDLQLSLAPGDAEARFSRGLSYLLAGDLAHGWIDYEFRLERRAPPETALQPQWRGEDVASKTVLIYAEQGLGDSIQFLRYASVLAERGAKVLAAVQIPLMTYAAGVAGVHEVVQPTHTLPAFDFCCPLPSLPRFCGTSLETIPPPPRYAPTTDRLAQWATRIGQGAALTVAISWAGNPDHANDHNRSIAFGEMEPLLRLPGVRWLTLQKGARAEGIAARDGVFLELGDELRDFADTAAVVALADLVITVDTSLCHLAGSVGRPVWTLLPHAPDWRWLCEGVSTPWYPSMRLFRQPRPCDWTSVIKDVSDALSNRVAEVQARRHLV